MQTPLHTEAEMGVLGPYLEGGYGFVSLIGATVISRPQAPARILPSIPIATWDRVGGKLHPTMVTMVTITA